MALSDVIAEAELRLGRRVGSKGRSRGVPRSSEFRRIEALPRRVWHEAEDLDELARLLKVAHGKEDGTMSLWRAQAAALRDVYEQRGLFAPLPVGAGKTLVSFLAPRVLGAVRPVLFVPPDLRDKTRREFREYGEHWNLGELLIMGSNELSLAKNADFLTVYQPDVVVIDEGHEWKNKRAARVRRLNRYLDKLRPGTVLADFSGTITRKSIKDYAHRLQWALGKDGSPLPTRYRELELWALALDADVAEYDRIAPGALARLCDEGENVRQGYRRRFVETPGVVSGAEDDLGVSLRVDQRAVEVPPEVHRALEHLYETWQTPGGDYISEAAHLWQVARQVSCGFYYRWNPAPPKDWLAARKEWKAYVRETIRRNRRGLDSELQVWNECVREFPDLAVFAEWRDLRDTFKPKTETVWFSDFLVDDVRKWLDEGPGIAWTEHVAFGERFENYFGAGVDIDPSVDGPIVASVKAHGQGKNLQRWHRNLVVTWPSSGKTCEQMIGRTHRPGQAADVVSVHGYFHTQVMRDSFQTSVDDAHYLQDTTGIRQKLLLADVGFQWHD